MIWVLVYACVLVLISLAMLWTLHGRFVREVCERTTLLGLADEEDTSMGKKLAADVLQAHAGKHDGTSKELTGAFVAALSAVFMVGAAGQHLAIGQLDTLPTLFGMPMLMSVSIVINLMGFVLCERAGSKRRGWLGRYVDSLERYLVHQGQRPSGVPVAARWGLVTARRLDAPAGRGQ